MLFLLITLNPNDLPDSGSYDGLTTYLHIAASLTYFFFLFIRGISSLSWILLRLCDAEFDS